MYKTINSIRYVPLAAMTERDWLILDWDFLRNKAKNRIAAMIVAGTLAGFHHVNVLMKARAKPDYYWPTEFGDEELDSDTADFFRYEADDEFESGDVESVDQMIAELRSLPLTYLERLLIVFIADKVFDQLLSDDKKQVKNIKATVALGQHPAFWIYLYLAILFYRLWGALVFEEMLDRVDREMENNA